ncbi:Zn(2)-C7 fungal-type transcription factor [Pseudohyphozyma bogoriensis]|nr:Zn(2)-C7 fungal-type transcription factor [Pseudohyphozyma bogoriensis]
MELELDLDIPTLSPSTWDFDTTLPVASTSTLPPAPTPSAQPPPQPPTTTTKLNKSCQPCRLRRVKCERVPGEDLAKPCIKCIAKGIQCTPIVQKSNKGRKLNRGGARIEAAKAIFGQATATAPREDQDYFKSYLLDYASASGSDALIRTGLDTYSEQAARLNHKMLSLQMGPYCSAMDKANGTQIQSVMISDLLDLKMADEKGTFRKATVEGIAALTILESVYETTFSPGKPHSTTFSSAYNAHAKHLLEKGDSSPQYKVAGTVLGWLLYQRDSVRSGKHGRAPTFTEEDLHRLRDGEPVPSPLAEALIAPRSEDVAADVWALLRSLQQHLANSSYAASRRLTGLFARQAPYLDEAFCDLHLCDIQLSQLATPKLRSRITDLFRENDSFTIPRYNLELGEKDLRSFFRGLRAALCGQGLVLHKTVVGRLEEVRERRGKEGFEVAREVAYEERLEKLVVRTRHQAVLGARELINFLEESLTMTGPKGTSALVEERGNKMLFASMANWVPLLVDTKTFEEGGLDQSYTYEVKLKELGWVLKATCAIGYSYPELSTPYTFVKDSIERIEHERAQSWDRVLNGMAVGPEEVVDVGAPPPPVLPSNGTQQVFSEEELQRLLGLDQEITLESFLNFGETPW